jgi:hypothetical protein
MTSDSAEPYVDPRDREYADGLPDDERKVVLATVMRFRRPDRLHVGAVVPDLELHDLDGARVPLASLAGGRPLVLVFGSFT